MRATRARSVASSSDRSLFFCFGPAKSGTTLLQYALNLHPQVSCPSEHNFTNLRASLGQVLAAYNETLGTVDRRTGGQGATLVSVATGTQVFRAAVEAIVRQAAGDKSIMGANDNSILRNLPLYDEVFEHPRMIAIFRNPIDQGLSGWHHNLRLAAEENDPRHRESLARHVDLAGWLRHRAAHFAATVRAFRAFAEQRDHVHAVRFEDLVVHRVQTLRRVFTFLGASADDVLLQPIVAATTLEAMRGRSRYPAFFRRGATDYGLHEVSPELRRELLEQCADAMAWLGYAQEGSEAG